MKTTTAIAAALLILSGCASTAPIVSPSAKADLAPQGVMRMGILPANPLHVTAGTGEQKGFVVDLGREIARHLGVELRTVSYNTTGALLDGAARGEWDVAFMGYAKERLGQMNFTPVLVNGENTYVVRSNSPLRSVADVDRDGVKVATSARTVQEAFLRGNLRRAALVPVANNIAGLQELTAGRVDAVAANRQTAIELNAATPNTRLLDGSFMHVPYVIAIKKGSAAGTAFATELMEHLKATGAVEEAIKRAKLNGISVAR